MHTVPKVCRGATAPVDSTTTSERGERTDASERAAWQTHARHTYVLSALAAATAAPPWGTSSAAIAGRINVPATQKLTRIAPTAAEAEQRALEANSIMVGGGCAPRKLLLRDAARRAAKLRLWCAMWQPHARGLNQTINSTRMLESSHRLVLLMKGTKLGLAKPLRNLCGT